MNERELLVDCLQRLNRTGVTYYLKVKSSVTFPTLMQRLSTVPLSIDH